MIEKNESMFLLSTKSTSMLLNVNEINKVDISYYGKRLLSLKECPSLIRKYPYAQGSDTYYDNEHQNFSLNQSKNIVSTLGKGDLFSPSVILKREDCSVFDFIYVCFDIREPNRDSLFPIPANADNELVIILKEKVLDIYLKIHIYVYENSDVFGFYTEVINKADKELHILKCASVQLPLINNDYLLNSTFGCWCGELSTQKEKLTRGKKTIESLSGLSSNRHNPFFFISEENKGFDEGNAYGFNFIYSSNFEDNIEMDAFENIRIQIGISSTAFDKKLNTDESFITPMAILTYSDKGINKMSASFHNFINSNVIPSEFRYKDRPIAYNNWEATSFSFTQSKIHSLMKKASKLSMELFVLDDGWFGKRNDDYKGLGDWYCNKKKLPGGLKGLSDQAKKLGMKFGIWMEPEMVNEDSDLYRAHPEYVIQDYIHQPSYGRHQLMLDLRKKEVQDFVVESVCNTLGSADISYLKWDCNRTMSDYLDKDGTFFYDYTIGLYSALRRIREKYPLVLMENCAGGGNRFDLGMLSFFAQSWQSDDTDSYQRIYIQEGGSLGYPLSTLSNHVSCKTSNQMLRNTTFDAKFDVACFGVLGYELDLDDLSSIDEQVIKSQVEFYKKYRHLLQFGEYSTDNLMGDKLTKRVQVKADDKAIVGYYQTIQKPYPKEGHLKVTGLKEDKLYKYTSRQESLPLRKFGSLINYVTPIHINPEGQLLTILEKHKDMKSEIDEGVASGASLACSGPVLSQEWSGVGYDERIRLIGDFSGRIYVIN